MKQHQGEKTNTIFLLYEKGHIEELERFWREHPDLRTHSLVVATAPELEERLHDRGIAFVSGHDYRSLDSSGLTLSEKWTASVLRSREWEWLQYRDVPFAEIFFFSVQYCFLQAIYYGTIIENIYTAHQNMRTLIIFPSLQEVPLKGRPFDRARIAATVDCARLIGAKYGFDVVVPEKQRNAARASRQAFSFAMKQTILDYAISIWNISIGLIRPRGTPRILASDYWRNIAPILSRLPHGELMLFDRGESLKAGFSNLWRYRVRLYNFGSFSIRSWKQKRAETQHMFEKRWRDLRDAGLPECSLGNVSLRPLLIGVLDDLILREVPKMLRSIDGAYGLLATLKPDIVFLRTSFSSQSHFYILALTARALGIPSLELQHGLEYLGPRSISTQHSAEYVAVYGKVVQDEFVALGLSRENFPIVGSPRFDAYLNKSSQGKLDQSGRSGMSVLCIGFTADAECFFDDYDVRDYYSALARALENVPGSSVVIKMRPGAPSSSRFAVDTIFARVPHTIAQHEPLTELFLSTDIVFSYYSTSVLEALQFGKPTIIFSPQPMEKEQIRFHFTQYVAIGGCIIANTQEELESACRSLANDSFLRDRLARGSKEALTRFHQFDGKASERIVELIERLSQKQK